MGITRANKALGALGCAAMLTFTVGPAAAAPDPPSFVFNAQPNPSGWVVSPLSITVSCAPGIAAEPASIGPVTDQPSGGRVSATCIDVDGTQASGQVDLPGIDLADPSLEYAFSSAPGASGWFTDAPTVSYVCSDATSGIAACPPQERLPDGAGPWLRTAVDRAGRSVQRSIEARVDTTAPALSVSVPRDGAAYEIGVATGIAFGCTDATSGIAACDAAYGSGAAARNGAHLDVGQVGNPGSLGTRRFTVTARDHAGHQRSRTVDYSVVDTRAPSVPPLAGPARDAVTSNRTPTLSWGASQDAGAGMREYRINVGGKTYTLPASAALQSGFTLPDELVDGTYEWQVFAVDQSGNSSASPKRRFRVDPSAGGAPVVTGGPQGGGATSSRTPTFTFSGAPGAVFSWRVVDTMDVEIPGSAGSGQGPATLPPLADGVYSFSVTQTMADGRQSDAAVALFRVDTTPPGAPRITAAPTSTNDRQPSFAWAAAEQGGTFGWQIVNPAGVAVQGPAVTGDTSVRVPSPLAPGAFRFSVRQRDVAGNWGPWSDPASFNVVGPPAAPAAAKPTTRSTALARPATRFPTRLRPRVGSRLSHRRVILRWRRVPAASLYNVQVYRLVGRRYRKVFTAFPRTNRVRVPLKRMKPGQRYMWRVWPYMRSSKRFTKRPMGISWFDTRKLTAKQIAILRQRALARKRAAAKKKAAAAKKVVVAPATVFPGAVRIDR